MNSKFEQLFKSNKHANLAIFAGIFLTIIYKVWKWYLRNNLDLDPRMDYYLYEMYSTFFRYFGAMASIGICYYVYYNRNYLWKHSSKNTLFALLIYLLGFFIIKTALLGYGFAFKPFIFELPVNFAVGFWEEFAFRGLIFAGLCRYLNFFWAALISSIYFSLWHFDVYNEFDAFISLFLSSIVFSSLYYLKTSLLVLSIAHFVLDQIHFGFAWKGNNLSLHEISLMIFEIVFGIVLLIWIYRQKTSRSSTLLISATRVFG